MDIGRKPYKAPCRFFRDDDAVGEITWFEVDADTPVINMDCTIGRYYNGPHLEVEPPVGELIDAPRKFEQTFPDLFGEEGRYCGTPADFLFGGLYRPADPPRKLTDFGEPCCCNDIPLIPDTNTTLPFCSVWDYVIGTELNATQWPDCTPDLVEGMFICVAWPVPHPASSRVKFDWQVGTAPGLGDIASGHYDGPAFDINRIVVLGPVVKVVWIPLDLKIYASPVFTTMRNAVPVDDWHAASAFLWDHSRNLVSHDGVTFGPAFGMMSWPVYSMIR